MTLTIRPEEPNDIPAIRQINDVAFGGDGEGQLVDALRDGGYAPISLVAQQQGQLIGHILYSPLAIASGDVSVPALALAPMAVLPDYQRQGVGTQLVEASLDMAREQGHEIVIVLGHPEYYPRFGFRAELARPLESPYAGEAFMALELVPGALDGVRGEVRYAPPFGEM